MSPLSLLAVSKQRDRGLGPSKTWSILPVREVLLYQRRVESMLYLRRSILALKWRWLDTCPRLAVMVKSHLMLALMEARGLQWCSVASSLQAMS